MTDPTWMRPSNLPRLAKCPASGFESEGRVSPDSDAAAKGRAWHKIAEIAIRFGRQQAKQSIAQVALELEVAPGPLLDWLEAFSGDFDGVLYTEHELTMDGVRGHADLVRVCNDHVEVIDYKTGNPDYFDESVFEQVRWYATAAALAFEKPRAVATVSYIELGAEGWQSREIVDLATERARVGLIFTAALLQRERPLHERTYRVGEQCTFCPGRVECPARNQELRVALKLFDTAMPTIVHENALPLLARAKAVIKAGYAVTDAVKAFVEENGGDVTFEDGRRLRIVEYERKAYEVPAGKVKQLREIKT